jgi:hypothetical protein
MYIAADQKMEKIMRRRFVLIFLACFYASLIIAQTSGTLSISVTTSSTGGNYAPRNVLAIWIEDSSGKFVKTLLAYANTRKTHLNTWETSTTASGSVYNSVDAITGATQSSHATRTCSWNGTDYTGKQVADGTYKIWMELTDKNATGNTGTFTFTKGPNDQKLTPATIPSFSSISINWTRSIPAIHPELSLSNAYIVYPNPGTGHFTVLGENIKSLRVTDLSGKEICKSTTPVVDLSTRAKGIYLVTIQTNQETLIRKIIKE